MPTWTTLIGGAAELPVSCDWAKLQADSTSTDTAVPSELNVALAIIDSLLALHMPLRPLETAALCMLMCQLPSC